MKDLIVGGIYEVGLEADTEYCVIVSQDNEKVEIFMNTHFLSSGLNSNIKIIEEIKELLKDQKLRSSNFYEISIDNFDKYDLTHGYLGNIDEEILRSLKNIAKLKKFKNELIFD